MNHHLVSFILFILLTAIKPSIGQNTNYTQLYTSLNFTKTIDLNLPVGTIGASSDASAGTSSYTIPIGVPPGTNGVVPSISVSYNSLSGNGILGRGWNLSGLSVISRVSQTIYHDGTVEPVEVDAGDRFALEGTRLILKSGTYGSNGATYGTETENFATLTSNGNLGGGPLWFSFITKDGITMEYGNTIDSRFLNSDDTKVLFWRINKISYTDGNYIEFKYVNGDRDSRIDEINYTGNSVTGLLPYNKLKFTYTIRSDVSTSFEAGASIVSKYLLDMISITTEGGFLFKSYSFKYATNNYVNSFLKEIVESGSDGTSLNSTIFKYGDIPNSFQTGTSNAIVDLPVDVFSGDVNGDGYTDIIACTRNVVNNIVYHTDFKVYQKNPSPSDNTFIAWPTVTLPPNYIAFQPYIGSNHNQLSADFNGDMAADIIFTKTTGIGSARVMSEIRVYTSPTSGTSYGSPQIITPYNGWNIIHTTGKYFEVGDFNGDGRTDILTMLGQSSTLFRTAIYYGGGSYWTDTGTSGSVFFTEDVWPTVDRINVLDLNGDGKDDLMLIKDANCEIFTYGDIQNAKRIYLAGFPTKWHLTYFGDFNGDGKTDILSRTSTTDNNSLWYKSISTGTGFVESPIAFNQLPDVQDYFHDQVFIADFNGDGKMDIFHGWNYWINQYTLAAKIDMYYSKGDGFYWEQNSNPNPLITDPKLFTFDLNADGRSDIFSRNCFCNPIDILYFNKEGKDLLLHMVKNGVDHTTEWTYKRMTEAGSFYTRGALSSHPLNNVQFPINLVYEFKSQNGIGGNTTMRFDYTEAKLHKEGKGFLGIKMITSNNLATGMKSVNETEFNSVFYMSALYKSSTYLASGNILLHQSTFSNQFTEQVAGSKRVWVKLTSTASSTPFENRYGYSNNTYDTFGNITTNVSSQNSLETITTVTAFGAFGTPIPAKPTSTTITKNRTGAPTDYVVTNTYTWNSLGQMTSKTDFSGLPQSVTTTYSYNTLGSQSGITVSPTGMTPRSITFGYDSKGRYPTSMTNPLLQTASTTYDPKWGKPISETGINGLTTTYTYDAFGRLSSTLFPTNFSIVETYGWDINVTDKTIYYHLTSHPGKPNVKVWYDLIDRESKNQVEGFQNEWITVKTTYDSRGNIATTTAPYKASESILTTTNSYDTYNRLTTQVNTMGTTSYGFSYNGSGHLTTTLTNPASQVSSRVSDPTGKALSATDYGGTLTYTYNSQGNVTEVKQGTIVMVTNEFDAYGRQTKLIDINAGTTQYGYNAMNEMISEISALNQTSTISYDLLGRITLSSGPEGATTYEYFPSASSASTNLIKKITGFSGDIQEFTYDTYGRLSEDKVTIDGIVHTTNYSYNIYNDIISKTYPSGFIINSTYDANGYLTTLKNGANTITLFNNMSMNGFNQYKSFTLGNGKASTHTYYFGIPTRYYTASVQDLNLIWNYQSGNLSSRYDALKGKTESFTYDNLNRLLTSSGTGLQTITLTYGTNGNINTKTDAGTFTYGTSRINAVTGVTNPSSIIPTLTQDIVYTSYYQPASITEGIYLLTYTDGRDKQRIKGVLKQSGNVVNTRYYFGGYEKNIVGSSTKHIHYISSGQQLIAIVVRENGVDSYNYIYTDHIGSLLTVTNNVGTVIAEQNFDPWGRKRNPINWTYTSVPSVPVWLYRGFTGHEQLGQFNLINMNGRIYDPVVGRMLSPDNHIQMPGFTQNFNRYSYGLNNPLRFTDPDGEWVHIVIGAVVGGLINGIAHGNRPGGFWKGFVIGAAAGAVLAATGGAVLVASGLEAASLGGGMLASTSGTVFGSYIQGFGNSIVFGDEYSPEQWGKDVLYAGLLGGASGLAGAIYNNLKGIPSNIWTGQKPTIGRSIWSFNSQPNYKNAIGSAFPETAIGQSDDLYGGSSFRYGESPYGATNAGMSAYEKALAGGTHSKWANIMSTKSSSELLRGVSSIESNILKHQNLLKDPAKYMKEYKDASWLDLDPRQQQSLLNKQWPQDIKRGMEQLDILLSILKSRQ